MGLDTHTRFHTYLRNYILHCEPLFHITCLAFCSSVRERRSAYSSSYVCIRTCVCIYIKIKKPVKNIIIAFCTVLCAFTHNNNNHSNRFFRFRRLRFSGKKICTISVERREKAQASSGNVQNGIEQMLHFNS